MSMIGGLLVGIVFGLIHSTWTKLIGTAIVYGLICATYSAFRARKVHRSSRAKLVSPKAEYQHETDKLLRTTEGMVSNAHKLLQELCDKSDPDLTQLEEVCIPLGTTSRSDVQSLINLREAARQISKILQRHIPQEVHGSAHLLSALVHNLQASVTGIDIVVEGCRAGDLSGADVQLQPSDPDYVINQTNLELQRKGLGTLSASEVFAFELIISGGACLVAGLATFGIKTLLV